MHEANFGFLFYDERRATLGAWLGNGHERRREIAIRIARAAVEDTRTAAASSSGTAAPNEFALNTLRTFDAHGDGARVFALGISGAADKFAEAAVLFDEAVAAKRALFVEQLVGLHGFASTLDKTASGLAIRICRASQKRSEPAGLDDHFFAAVVAILDFYFTRSSVWQSWGQILNEIAVGIA